LARLLGFPLAPLLEALLGFSSAVESELQ
jgi:hypothetical protein